MSRQAYPRLYQSILDMVPEVALEVINARSVARKAGLRRGTGTVETAVVSDYIGVAEQPYARQWLVDLTDCTMARFYAGSTVPVQLLASDSVASGAFDPGFGGFFDVDFDLFESQVGDVPEWRGISFAQRGPLRLTLFGNPQSTTGTMSEPFPVLLQVV